MGQYIAINSSSFASTTKYIMIGANLIKVRFKSEKPHSGFMLIEFE